MKVSIKSRRVLKLEYSLSYCAALPALLYPTIRLRNGADKPARVLGPLGFGPGSGNKIINPESVKFVIIYFITHRVP